MPYEIASDTVLAKKPLKQLINDEAPLRPGEPLGVYNKDSKGTGYHVWYVMQLGAQDHHLDLFPCVFRGNVSPPRVYDGMGPVALKGDFGWTLKRSSTAPGTVEYDSMF